ncbi:hypothetical protein D3C80_1592120 [compost metagenome]
MVLRHGPLFQGLMRHKQRRAYGGFQRTLVILAIQSTLHGILWTAGQQAVQIEWPTGFRPGARQSLAAKRLHAYHCTHHIAVNIQVTDLGMIGDSSDGFIDTGMDTQRQTIA